MNIFLIGGVGSFINNMIIKCRKEGHRVSVLTGSKYAFDSYEKTFEIYRFTYDSASLYEIFESVSPDVTICMGAFDTNFAWANAEADHVRFSSAYTNILSCYARYGRGRLIFLSSSEVFSTHLVSNILEATTPESKGYLPLALSQTEELCNNYRRNMDLDIILLRLDCYYGPITGLRDCYGIVGSMFCQAVKNKAIHFNSRASHSLIYMGDAIEAIYRIVSCRSHSWDIYNISSSEEIPEEEIAHAIRNTYDYELDIEPSEDTTLQRRVLSNERFSKEFGSLKYYEIDKAMAKVSQSVKSVNLLAQISQNESAETREKKGAGWFFGGILPFIENIVIFAGVYFLNNLALSSQYFARLDIFLLYVLLMALVYGQVQATLAALLSVFGFFFSQIYRDRTAFELLMDANTYVWIAQLFIMGLSVGYIKDLIGRLRLENQEAKEFLEVQLDDIKSINSTNARIKGVLETQIVNQSDSVGKVFSITSELDRYSPEEVLFYAAETVGRLMGTKDVAIYLVSNASYARLFSSTSEKARSLGNSIPYTEMGDMYEDLRDHKVFINRKLESDYPLMANAVYENDRMQIIIMIWGLSWQNMTLGQANTLTVVSALIQNSVLRANRYMEAILDKRFVDGTQLMETESFTALVKAFMTAAEKGLTQCTLVRVGEKDSNPLEEVEVVKKNLRQSDYFGSLPDEYDYVLLANTSPKDSEFIKDRFAKLNIKVEIIENIESMVL